jgi:ribosomal protein S18 acetylase RimI-like enzyme
LPDKVVLRPQTVADEALVLALYRSTRAEELAMLPWSEEQKSMFVDMQFRAQSAHFQTNYPGGRFDVIEIDGQAAGRFYVSREPTLIAIIDIVLAPEFRGQGVGTELVRAILDEARAAGKKVTLHVEKNNAGAARLYKRLGFVDTEDRGFYTYMEWT